MAVSTENANGVFFYATFDKPEAAALESFKAALGAVPKEAQRNDGTTYVKLHTDRAGYQPLGPAGQKIPAWRISADVLGEVRLEDYFKNVKYFASKDAVKQGIESTRDSVAQDAANAAVLVTPQKAGKAEARAAKAAGPAPSRARKPVARQGIEYYEHVKEYVRDPAHKAGIISAKDVMLYAANKAKYLAGFTGKEKFGGDIASAVDSDKLFTIGLQGTRAAWINLAAVKAVVKKAAAEGRSGLAREEARYASALQDEANAIRHENVVRGLKRSAGVTVAAAFPPEVQAESLDVARQKRIDENKAGIRPEEKGPSKGALEAEAFLNGSSPVLSRSAVKSQAGKLFWELARDSSLGPKGIEERVNSDRILNAPESAFQDKEAYGLLQKQREVLIAKACETQARLDHAAEQYSARPDDYKLVSNKIIHMNFLDVGAVMGNAHERQIGEKQEQERAMAQSSYAVQPASIGKAVIVAVGREDKDLQAQITSLGGRWSSKLQAWSVPEENAGKLDLGGRGQVYASVADKLRGKAAPAAAKAPAQENAQELADKQEAGLSR